MSTRFFLCAVVGLFWSVTGFVPAAEQGGAGKVRVVLIDGRNNHDWTKTTPFMKRVMEESGRFTVDVSTHPQPDRKIPEGITPVPFPPDLSKYDVVVSNYNDSNKKDAAWPDDFRTALDERLKNNQIGLVIIHAANNAFGGWKEYNLMIGMGWRGKKFGERLKLDDEGKLIRMPAGEDLDSNHRYSGPFVVTIRDPEHPVTKGMPREWMHTQDELYDNMRGPIQNVHLLATAYSKGTKAHEPMIWTVGHGKGRVFHTPLGHDLNGMRCVGFVTTLNRGTEWAATGKVTLPIPTDFPTADKTSSLAK